MLRSGEDIFSALRSLSAFLCPFDGGIFSSLYFFVGEALLFYGFFKIGSGARWLTCLTLGLALVYFGVTLPVRLNWPEEKPWNIQKTPEHIYRVIHLSYSNTARNRVDANKMAFYRLSSPLFGGGLSPPETREECRESIGNRVRGNRYDDRKDALLLDRNTGIVVGGIKSAEGKDHFFASRFLCLPMEQIDDLDLVGTVYKDTTFGFFPDSNWDAPVNEPAPMLHWLAVSYNDPLHDVRYDADRFFARFEQYGISRTLVVPSQNKVSEKWPENPWKDSVFIFPLDQANK